MKQKKKTQNASDDKLSTTTGNRYQILYTESNDDERQETANFIKPPPLFISNVNSIVNMINDISSVSPRRDFTYKAMRNNGTKVMISRIDAYRKLVKYFDTRKIGFHNYRYGENVLIEL